MRYTASQVREHEGAQQTALRRRSTVKGVGQALTVAGVIGFLLAAFVMPTSVGSAPYGTDVVNLSLQQRQMVAVIGSACIFIAGMILIAAAGIADSMSGAVARTAPTSPGSDLPANPASVDDDVAVTMQRYGILKELNGYRYGGFVYSRLEQAVRQAERGGGNN